MKRALRSLADTTFDLLIVGGGAFGAAAAWDATLRGLTVALVERNDFGSGASAECFKMVHGGIRYLQHGDLSRLRSSCAERSAMLRIAPHLVAPLPIALPTYGWGAKGKPLLLAGMRLYDALSFDRNLGINDPARRIAGTQVLSRQRCLELFPGINPQNLTGAAVFEDGQMYNAARLVLAFVQSAANAGAQVANYAEATRFLWIGQRVCGARIRDRLSGEEFDLRAKLVLNAAGPGAEYLLQGDERFGQWQRGVFSRDAYFIVDRAPTSGYALAIPGQSRDKDALLSRSARHMFAVPWRNRTLIGVWHRVVTKHPDELSIEEEELEAWMTEVNTVYPSLKLRREDVVFSNCGLVPFGDPRSTAGELSFGKESRFLDHRKLHGIEGLVTLVGIRFTTARADAATALDLLLKQLPLPPGPAPTATTPLTGADFVDFESLLRTLKKLTKGSLPDSSVVGLAHNQGSHAIELLRNAESDRSTLEPIAACGTLRFEVRHCVNNEMALHLEDMVLRRTDLGAAGHPGAAALRATANEMRQILSWSEAETDAQIAATERVLRRHHAIASQGPSPSPRRSVAGG